MRKLTAKQQRFAEEYLVDLNGTQAAIRAGYSSKTANEQAARLLAKDSVQAYVTELRQAQSKRTQIDADYVLGTIHETVERCRQTVRPKFDRRGDPVMAEQSDGSLAQAYEFDSKAVLKGCELLGRNLALWKDRVEHTGKDGGPIQTEEISETERARRIAFVLSKATRETVQ